VTTGGDQLGLGELVEYFQEPCRAHQLTRNPNRSQAGNPL
jgi:hypothetical protein